MLVAYSSGVVFTGLPCQGTFSQGPFSLSTRSAGYSFRHRLSIFYHIPFYLSNPIFVRHAEKPHRGRMWKKRFIATGKKVFRVEALSIAARDMGAEWPGIGPRLVKVSRFCRVWSAGGGWPPLQGVTGFVQCSSIVSLKRGVITYVDYLPVLG